MLVSNSTSWDTHYQRIVRTAAILTLGIVVCGCWYVLQMHGAADEKMVRALRVEELRGDILHLDELLTMSAHMGMPPATWPGRIVTNSTSPRWITPFKRLPP